MLSLAIVSLSLCSAAISSSTGATILHGPHHSAQKSTSTGLSLPSTSLAKLASVTVLVLPAMVVLSVVVTPSGASVRANDGESGVMPCGTGKAPSQGAAASLRAVGLVRRWNGPRAGPRAGPARRGGHGGPSSALVEGLGEPALGVDGRLGAGAGRGDGLPVDVVDHVAAGEHAVD